MGQKSNLITITNHTTSLNFCNLHSKFLIKNLKYVNFFEIFLKNKNICLLKFNSSTVNNITFISLYVFFRSKKIIRLKRKLSKKKFFLPKKYLKTYKFLSILNEHKQKSLVCVKIFNLNFKIKNNLVIKFYHFLKSYRSLYFQRVFNLFVDFIKICSLFCKSLIDSKSFLFFLSLIFKAISKKLHVRFIYFVKKVFKFVLHQIKRLNDNNRLEIFIKGVKFSVSGRLRDKQRSSFICLQEGVIPISNLEYGVDFCKRHVHTIYGVFGLKIWIFKDIL
jgi:hypothetical protein